MTISEEKQRLRKEIAWQKKQYPAEAEELFAEAKKNAQWRYNNYRRLALQHWGQNPDELK